MYGQFLIILFSMIALCAFAMIVDEIDVQEWSKRRAITVVSLLPNFAILSSIFLRESLVTMWITVSLYFFFRWFKSGSMVSFALAFATCFCAAAFHSGSVACVAGYIVVMMLYNRKEGAFTFTGKGLFFAGIFLVGFVFLFVNYGDVLFGKMLNVDSLEDVGNTNALGRTSYAQYVGDSRTPVRMAIFTLPRIFFFLFSPLPWMWSSIGDIIAFVFSSLFYFFAVVKAFKSLPYQSHTNKSILVGLLVVAACSVFVFAWGVSNAGTAARHRDKMVCLFGLIYLFGCDKTENLTFQFGGRII